MGLHCYSSFVFVFAFLTETVNCGMKSWESQWQIKHGDCSITVLSNFRECTGHLFVKVVTEREVLNCRSHGVLSSVESSG